MTKHKNMNEYIPCYISTRNEEEHLEIEGGWEIAINPFGGSLSVVWMPLGSQNPSQLDLNLQKPASYACWKSYTQQYQWRKTFVFLGQKFFLKKIWKKLYYDDHTTILC
jgi:hypothetical protein